MLKWGGRGTTSFAIVLTQALEYLAMLRGRKSDWHFNPYDFASEKTKTA